MNIYEFMDANPWQTFFLGFCVIIVFGMVATLIQNTINRTLRHANIRKHGYPPPHCDADGDFRPEKQKENPQ